MKHKTLIPWDDAHQRRIAIVLFILVAGFTASDVQKEFIKLNWDKSVLDYNLNQEDFYFRFIEQSAGRFLYRLVYGSLALQFTCGCEPGD